MTLTPEREAEIRALRDGGCNPCGEERDEMIRDLLAALDAARAERDEARKLVTGFREAVAGERLRCVAIARHHQDTHDVASPEAECCAQIIGCIQDGDDPRYVAPGGSE